MAKTVVIKFRRGQTVLSHSNKVMLLVTDQGDKKLDYPAIAGVVIWSEKDENENLWPIGLHSDAWGYGGFKKVDIKLSKLLSQSVK